jgi:hypothetical protein
VWTYITRWSSEFGTTGFEKDTALSLDSLASADSQLSVEQVPFGRVGYP